MLDGAGFLPRRFAFAAWSLIQAAAANRSLRLINHDRARRNQNPATWKRAVMRRLLVLVSMIGLGSQALAGDFDIPTLRGTSTYAGTVPEFSYVPAAPRYMRWSGFYGGANVGYGMSNMDFSRATQALAAFELRVLTLENEQHVSQWQVLGKKDNHSTSYGGFAGYNSQWDDVILGVELNYNASNYFADAPNNPLGRRVPAGGNTYDVLVSGSASMHITDHGTARARAGYVMQNIMPYVTAGFAFGRADIAHSVTVSGQEITPDGTVTPFSFSASESKKEAWIFGWSVGGGVEFMMLPNVFVRTEVEHSDFTRVYGIKSTVTTGRVGGGIKF
jgi:outer membrane immunogenic protein